MNFLPHSFCLSNPALQWLFVICDLLIMFAYYGIPVALMALYAARPRTTRWDYSIRSSLMVLFAAFIFACGTSHLFEALVMFVPWYWAELVVKVFTAGISLVTMGIMFMKRKSLVAFPTKVEEEHQELVNLRKSIALKVQNI